MVNNKTYYGEYTLKHWVDLILTKNIILPEYQRYFVWDKKKSIALLEAFVDNQFVPPVTIGSYSVGDNKTNLILDGQQRLTSILLAYFNLFPTTDKKQVKEKALYYANENDDEKDSRIFAGVPAGVSDGSGIRGYLYQQRDPERIRTAGTAEPPDAVGREAGTRAWPHVPQDEEGTPLGLSA